jgi:hypothetical protein
MIEDQEDYLDAMRRVRKESLHFFSNEGKAERERWTVKEFLTNLSIPFSESELISPPERSEIDVKFRSANFQVKEIPNPNIRRNAEIREAWLVAKKASKIGDLVVEYPASDIPSTRSGYDLVCEYIKFLENKYPPNVRKRLDILFYITRFRTALIQLEEINKNDLSLLGWRSISCLMGKHSYVLFAQLGAPLFLYEQTNGS